MSFNHRNLFCALAFRWHVLHWHIKHSGFTLILQLCHPSRSPYGWMLVYEAFSSLFQPLLRPEDTLHLICSHLCPLILEVNCLHFQGLPEISMHYIYSYIMHLYLSTLTAEIIILITSLYSSTLPNHLSYIIEVRFVDHEQPRQTVNTCQLDASLQHLRTRPTFIERFQFTGP